MGFIWIVVAGAATGFIAGKFMRDNEYGPIGDIAVGVTGALLATILFRFFGPDSGVGVLGGLVVVILGATALRLALRTWMQPAPAPVRRPGRR